MACHGSAEFIGALVAQVLDKAQSLLLDNCRTGRKTLETELYDWPHFLNALLRLLEDFVQQVDWGRLVLAIGRLFQLPHPRPGSKHVDTIIFPLNVSRTYASAKQREILRFDQYSISMHSGLLSLASAEEMHNLSRLKS